MTQRDAPARSGVPPREPPRAIEADDATLVALAQRGDDAAFRVLYRRHAQGVYGRLTRLLGPRDEREDLVQQVFWSFFRALPRYRGDAPVSAFLHGIVTRVAYDALRKRKRTPTAQPREADLEQLLSGEQSPEERLRAREHITALYAALDRIKPRKRIAFVLYAIEGLALTEIATLTGAEPRAIGQRIAAARNELERMLQRPHGRTTGASS
ncbi:MAG TPA: RNA polymerase sigma factor [Polyangiales bacterium]|nr:RNA polymerase sigma factor [Polyangiales bacterium]